MRLTAEIGSAARSARWRQAHRLCPFELSLALAQLADVVVCDYNYVFDPFVAIDALMQGGAALLIDEAHQLAPRVQDNASAAVSAKQLRGLRRDAGQALGRKHALYKALTAALRALEEAARTEEFAAGRLEKPPEDLNAAMEGLLDAAGRRVGRRRGAARFGCVFTGGLLAVCGGTAG